MKPYLLAILFLILSHKLSAQVFTVTVPLNTSVVCCSDEDSIDIMLNSLYDIKITSQALAIDGYMFHSTSINNYMRIAPLVNYGMPFVNFTDSFRIADLGWGVWNPAWWVPNTGYKYEGFRFINASGDTTYGWIKLDFLGNGFGFWDSIVALEYTFNIIPNVPLWAGQITPVSVNEVNADNKMLLSPNPASNFVNLKLTEGTIQKIEWYDVASSPCPNCKR